jgi:hypothetical protein
MTRETKIGLLVGLAFIIVIGILLSDHLTTSTEPPQARLAQAGDAVRSTITSPGATPAPPITLVTPQQQVQMQPVPVRTELVPPLPPPVQLVQIGPGQQQRPAAQPQQGIVQIGPANPQPQQPVVA